MSFARRDPNLRPEMTAPSPERPQNLWAQLEARPGAALLLSILCAVGAVLLLTGVVGHSKVRSREVEQIRSIVGGLLFLGLTAGFGRSAWRGWQKRTAG